jgi:hypothetical protein
MGCYRQEWLKARRLSQANCPFVVRALARDTDYVSLDHCHVAQDSYLVRAEVQLKTAVMGVESAVLADDAAVSPTGEMMRKCFPSRLTS